MLLPVMSDVRTDAAVFFRDLGHPPIVIERGDGVYLYDQDGRSYLDAASGAGVVSLGHGNREIASLLAKQAQELSFAHPVKFATEPMLRLASLLADRAPPGLNRVYFTSGGSESVESAIKLARQYHLANGAETKFKVLSRCTSYHGATLGALAVSGQQSRREFFAPLLMCEPRVADAYRYRCRFCAQKETCDQACARDLERVIIDEGPETVAAFIAEPVSGSSIPGCHASDAYWAMVREICNRHEVLLIADEVMSGNGRSGKWWAMQHTGIAPDIIATAKGIGAGYAALGAILVSEPIFDAVSAAGNFRHGHTYAGNPLACAVGSEVIRIIERDKLLENVSKMGEVLLQELRNRLGDHTWVGDIRGQGLLLGVEFVEDSESRKPFAVQENLQTKITRACLARGLYVYQGGGSAGVDDDARPLGDHVLIAPPFIIDEQHVDQIAGTLREALDDVLSNRSHQ
jgi:adenosylmethionine-8-amino-7-oxononanoate aminotransferase